ncbi:MAG: hypothetical protein RLZZ58_2243 [Pseudomonadota bacterium]
MDEYGSTMPARAPSWSSLATFRAAARCESFRDAAAELGVTTSAVSHQVKALESWIGAPLFERGIRIVRLTERGRSLAARLERGFTEIAAALDQAHVPVGPRVLRIAALPLFVRAWLAPRICAFEALHPQLSISIDTSARVADLERGEADVAIRNVAAPTPGLWAHKLLDIRAVPLCTAALAQRIAGPADLSGQTLVELNVGRSGWAAWFDAVGAGNVTPGRILSFDTMIAALDAAVEGRGVMLGLTPLIWELPAARTLVVPFDIGAQSAGSYCLVCRRQDRSDAMIRSFVDWLCAAMRADLPRLRQQDRACASR